MAHSPTLEDAELLASVEIFAGLDRVALAKLAAHLEPLAVADGDLIVRQGDPADAFYLVARGRLGVYVAIDEQAEARRIGTLGRGAPFGEMGLLTGEPRSATVRADGDANVLRLARSAFLDLVRREPQVALAIAATLSRRLRSANVGHVESADGDRGRSAVHAVMTPAAPVARPLRRPPRATVGLALAGAILLAMWMTPPPAGLTRNGWHALATLLAVVPPLALDALPEGILALTLAAVWVLTGIAPVGVALSGFASASWVLLVCVLAIGAAIASCGLLYRLALWIVAHARGGFPGQALALGVAGVLVGPAVPNATGRVTLIAPAIVELVEALGYAGRSRQAAGLAMATLIGFGQMASVFLTSSTTAVLVFAVLPSDARHDLSWITWAVRAAPANIVLFVGLIAAVVWLYRPRGATEPAGARRPDALALQRALLGRPSRAEQISFIVSAALLLGFITQPLHGVDPAWVAVLALAALAITGVVTTETLRAVNWSFALLFGMLASLSAVFTGARVDRWIAAGVAATVSDLAKLPVLFVVTFALLCFAVSLVVRWQAAAPLLTIALAPGAAAAGINPLIVGLIALIAGNGFFLPYQSTTYLALYHGTGGKLFTHAQARRMALAYGLATLIALCAAVPVWRAMGLL